MAAMTIADNQNASSPASGACDYHNWQQAASGEYGAHESSTASDYHDAAPYDGSNAPPDYSCHHQFHSADHKPILAERFKTKMCRNYERTGVCPYVHRCMFAHGDHELRNKTMNLADGLVTEEAIKYFKRVNYEAQRAMMYSECSSMGSTTPPPAPLTPYRHDPYTFVAWRPVTSKMSSASASITTSPTARTPSPTEVDTAAQ